jgi:carbon-monoxide dehydrogenase medium subunit
MLPSPASIACSAIVDGRIVHVRDASADPQLLQIVRDSDLRSLLAIPLLRDGKAIGAIALQPFDRSGRCQEAQTAPIVYKTSSQRRSSDLNDRLSRRGVHVNNWWDQGNERRSDRGITVKLPKFEYASPTTVREAVALLAAGNGTAKVLAGGQSLVPILAFRLTTPSMLVDIGRIAGLNMVKIDDSGIHLGARVRWCDIEANTDLTVGHPLLAAAVTHVAHYSIRKRGTVGGSLAHADPAAEMPGIAVACDAELTVVGPSDSRLVPAGSFFLGPLATVLAPDELITGIRFPSWPFPRRWGFQEFSRRRGDFALAGVAAFYDLDTAGRATNTHIGVIGVSNRPQRLAAAEALLNGRVVDKDTITATAEMASQRVDPPDDVHGTSRYRRALLAALVERALTDAVIRT